MELNGDFNRSLEVLDKALRLVRSEQRRHILDAERIRARALNLLRVVHVVLVSEDLARGVGNRNLRVSLLLFRRLDSGFEVSDIVEGVENSDDIDTVCDRFLNEILNQIVRVVTITEHILSSEQHLELGVGHFLSDNSQALPRVLVEEADAGIEGCAAPALRGVEANLVHFGQNRAHFIDGHSRCEQALVRVAENGFRYFQFSHNYLLF